MKPPISIIWMRKYAPTIWSNPPILKIGRFQRNCPEKSKLRNHFLISIQIAYYNLPHYSYTFCLEQRIGAKIFESPLCLCGHQERVGFPATIFPGMFTDLEPPGASKSLKISKNRKIENNTGTFLPYSLWELLCKVCMETYMECFHESPVQEETFFGDGSAYLMGVCGQSRAIFHHLSKFSMKFHF